MLREQPTWLLELGKTGFDHAVCCRFVIWGSEVLFEFVLVFVAAAAVFVFDFSVTARATRAAK